MKKHELKDYNRLLRVENEALREILHMAADSLSDDCRCGEIKLLQEENTELVKDINDLRADWAESNVVAGTAMLATATEISRVTEERERFRGIIRDLKKEKYDMGMELEKLKRQNARLTDNLITARKRLRDSHDRQSEELDEKDRTIRDLEEQISNLKAAVAPKPKAPTYAPGYERKGESK